MVISDENVDPPLTIPSSFAASASVDRRPLRIGLPHAQDGAIFFNGLSSFACPTDSALSGNLRPFVGPPPPDSPVIAILGLDLHPRTHRVHLPELTEHIQQQGQNHSCVGNGPWTWQHDPKDSSGVAPNTPVKFATAGVGKCHAGTGMGQVYADQPLISQPLVEHNYWQEIKARVPEPAKPLFVLEAWIGFDKQVEEALGHKHQSSSDPKESEVNRCNERTIL
ncbi:hypothetical protein B0H13DRAFT_2289912 [Mycena leptocephala]|nr:hypothetical protein B0H13DRAFT_2289912 [Mycena leptocephala]